jgi:CRISPR/Cas system CSM-associated protein Csm3 (group 7 of RAMP superfamily)
MNESLGSIEFKNEKAFMHFRKPIGLYLPINDGVLLSKKMKGALCKGIRLSPDQKEVVEFHADGKRYHRDMKPTIANVKSAIMAKNLSKKGGGERPAPAPYNFIPLNDKIVRYPKSAFKPTFDVFEKMSGYIDLQIEALTPVFTRGEKSQFFQIDDQPAIPGSSIRGMIRQLIEIVTFGAFLEDRSFEDRRLYNRSPFDESTRIKEYYERVHKNTVQAGFLSYEDGKYYIQPTSEEPTRTEKTLAKWKYVPKEEEWEVYSGLTDDKTEKKQWIIPPPDLDLPPIELSEKDIEDYRDDRTRNAEGPMENILETCRGSLVTEEEFPYGLPIFYAPYQDEEEKVRYTFGHTKYFRIPYAQKIKDHIPKKLRNWGDKIDLASVIFGFVGRDKKEGIRAGKVFFEDAGFTKGGKPKVGFPKVLGTPNPTSFQLYLAQEECGIKTKREDLDHWAVNEAWIRGYKAYWHRGERKHIWENSEPSLPVKVFDGNDQTNTDQGREKVQKLLENKEVAKFLIRGEGSKNDFKEVKLASDYSQYPESLRELLDNIFFPGNKKTKAQFQPIAPLPKGTEFMGRIRFENLMKEELGALLFVLHLESDMAHKIGLGKPLGLGSIRITPTLFLTGRKKRYTSLFQHGKWKLEENVQGEDQIIEIKNAFSKYIGRSIGKPEITSAPQLWQEDRIAALKTMLTFDHMKEHGNSDNWTTRTTHQELEQFKKRFVLPKPSEVTNPNTKFQS